MEYLAAWLGQGAAHADRKMTLDKKRGVSVEVREVIDVMAVVFIMRDWSLCEKMCGDWESKWGEGSLNIPLLAAATLLGKNV